MIGGAGFDRSESRNLTGASLRFIEPSTLSTARLSFGLLRSLRNFARLIRICLILARHDALWPLHMQQLGHSASVQPASRRKAPLQPRPGERLAAAFEEFSESVSFCVHPTRCFARGEELAGSIG